MGLSFADSVYVGEHLFILMQLDLFLKIAIVGDRGKLMLPAKKRLCAVVYQVFKCLCLKGGGVFANRLHLLEQLLGN